jgi:hypothetical protein
MMARTETRARETANDRFKRSAAGWVWGSVMLAAVFHFALFEYFPTLTAADLSREETTVFRLLPPPEIEIPPPPEKIQRPKVPVPGGTEVDEDVTIHPTTFPENPVDNLPAPPVEGIPETSRFTPYWPTSILWAACST